MTATARTGLRNRETFPWYDALWERLPAPARAAFLHLAVAGAPAPGAAADRALLVEHALLVGAGDDARVHPRAQAFADRLRRLHEHPVLHTGSLPDLAATVGLLLGFRTTDDFPPLARVAIGQAILARSIPRGAERDLHAFVATRDWLRRVPPMLEHQPGVRAALACLAGSQGLVSLAELSQALGAETYPALEVLLSHFVAWEGLDPGSHRLLVGLLPALRGAEFDDDAALVAEGLRVVSRPVRSPSPARRAAEPPAEPAPAPPPPVARPAELDTPAVPLVLDDLEAWLLHLAGARVRVAQTGAFWAEDDGPARASVTARGESRIASGEARFGLAKRLGYDLGLVDREGWRRTVVLRPSASAGEFLALPVARRLRGVVDELLTNPSQGWLGGTLDLLAQRVGSYPLGKEQVARLLDPLRALPEGAFHELRAVLAPWRGRRNPVLRLFEDRLRASGHGLGDVEDVLGRQLRYALDAEDLRDRAPLDALDAAYARGVRDLLVRLALVGGVELGDVLGERATLRLTDVGRYYLGFTRAWPAELPATGEGEPGRVVVQPNLEVLVLGRAPAVELALTRFAVREPGDGPARTYALSRERIVDAVAGGLAPAQVEQAFAAAVGGADVPQNVARTLADWARAVRRARLVHVPVLVCDDEETALTIRSHAGKDTLIDGQVVPVDPSKLAAFRKALQKKGIVVAEDDDERGPRRGRERRPW